MYIFTIDSNVMAFARQTADRLTRLHALDVSDIDYESVVNAAAAVTPTIDYRSFAVGDGTSSSSSSAVCRMKTRRSDDGKKPPAELSGPYPMYTLKSSWCNDIDGRCIPVSDVCKNIKHEYDNSDIVIYNTPLDSKQFHDLALCSGRKIVSFVYVNGQLGPVGGFMATTRAMTAGGVSVVLLLDRVPGAYTRPEDLRCFEHVIKINQHNCSRALVSKFVAYVVKSFQKYQTHIDLNTGKVAQKHTTVTYDFYTVMGLHTSCNP